MQIVKPSYRLLFPSSFQNSFLWEEMAKLCEYSGRTTYKTEDRITEDSWGPFIKARLSGEIPHEALTEFGWIVIELTVDRGLTHELVRHRLCSFMQESTRWVNYSKDQFGNQIQVICPHHIAQKGVDSEEYHAWEKAMITCEHSYLSLLDKKIKPQDARSVLPTCTKSTLVMGANFREWRHIFKLRVLSTDAHPDLRKVLIPFYEGCAQRLPEFFDMGLAKPVV